MHYVIIAVTLYFFWLLLSGHYTLMLMTLGLVSVALVTWFLKRMDDVDGEPGLLKPSFKLLQYLIWLFLLVIKSNIEVARLILNPALPIHPTWARLDTKVSTPLHKTLYANSITLTPGTLTTDVKDEHFIVHSLTKEGVEELREGEMENRILRLGA